MFCGRVECELDGPLVQVVVGSCSCLCVEVLELFFGVDVFRVPVHFWCQLAFDMCGSWGGC